LYSPMENFQETHGVLDRMGRVLLVDDEAAVRGTLRAVLESQGYDCDEAEHGAAALTILEQQHFDLIITDNKMPILNGVEFLKQYSQKPDPKPPVIFFTGDISDEEKELAMNAGARAVLQKPPNFGEIISAVQQAISD
jgi:CheY-like chemotaxis protein